MKFRTSTIIFSGLILFLALLILSGLIFLRVSAGNYRNAFDEPGRSAGETAGETARFDLSGKTASVTLQGPWQAEIRQGDETEMEITIPGSLDPDLISWNEKGMDLILTNRNEKAHSSITPTVRLTLASLDGLYSVAVSTIRFEGFEGDRLTVSCSGAAEVMGTRSRYKDLTVNLSGAGDMDFSDVETENADIQVGGAGSISLNMTGGSLSGNLAGMGEVTYSGTVSRNSLSTTGLGTVRQR